MEDQGVGRNNLTPLSIAAVVVILLMLAFVLYPVFLRGHRPAPPKSVCITNLREIGLAFGMYVSDYGEALPSSAICRSSDYTYRRTLGQIPPPGDPYYRPKTVSQLLYPYKKNVDIYFCPSDRSPAGLLFWKGRNDPDPIDRTSYVLKRAIDQAWRDPAIEARKDTDYSFPAEQILFYEHTSFHWGSDPIVPNGKEGASFNVCYFDGHVKTVRLADPGIEPDYYNHDPSSLRRAGKRQIDPRRYCDLLP